MTSTCLRDRDLVRRLHAQLVEHGVYHTLFVELDEQVAFREFEDVLTKPLGGGNGLGEQGAIVRWACHQKLAPRIAPTDTFVSIDSDVLFRNVALIDDLACGEGEWKGFGSHRTWATVLDQYYHASGMIIAAAGAVFHRAVSISLRELRAICRQLDSIGIAPSEDVVMSYLYQARGKARFINLYENYTRCVSHDYDSSQCDVVC